MQETRELQPSMDQLSLFEDEKTIAQPSLFGREARAPEPKPAAAGRPAPEATGRPEGARAPAADVDGWVRRLAGAPDLAALEEIVRGCTRCQLRGACRQVVFGEGDPRARLMVVGEGPGQVEDETGRPFVGPAGQLLDRMLAAIGLARREVYIANVVKCRPPNNRVPTPQEQAACWPNLRRQMELVRPDVVLCLGATAAHQLVDPSAPVGALRGRWITRDGVPYMVTFHPAALLRDPSKKSLAWQDLQQVQAALRVGGARQER